MRRYFYSASPLIKNWLQNQYNLTRMQDKYFRDALLASIKLKSSESSLKQNLSAEEINNLRETVLDMTMIEQQKYSNNMHLQLIFKHLETLYRNSRGKNMLIKGALSSTKDLVDPDKFPVWDLKNAKDIFYSRWAQIQGILRYDHGHQLIVDNSLVQHPSGGRGVFIILKQGKQKIYPGQFIGLVPGVVYASYNNYKNIKLNTLKSYQKIPQHLHFPSGKVLQLSEISLIPDKHLSNRQTIEEQSFLKAPKIQPELINPYSLGHIINHPPTDKQANVIFSEVQINQNFLPEHLRKKYLPYDYILPKQIKANKNKVVIFAIIACKQINSYEELYVDYTDSHIYPIQNIPQWMVEPNKNTFVNLSKGEYQHPTPSYWNWMQKQALKQKADLYQKYKSIIRRTPGKVIHSDDKVVIRDMKIQGNNTN